VKGFTITTSAHPNQHPQPATGHLHQLLPPTAQPGPVTVQGAPPRLQASSQDAVPHQPTAPAKRSRQNAVKQQARLS
jgi:hypothetical protein